MGIRITTDDYGVKVWRSDKYQYPQYAISISTEAEGERVTEYKQLQFRKGVELENGDEIYIENAFPKLRTWKDKQTGELRHKEVWMVLDFSYRARRESAAPKTAPKPAPAPAQISYDDMPDTFQAAEDDIPF